MMIIRIYNVIPNNLSKDLHTIMTSNVHVENRTESTIHTKDTYGCTFQSWSLKYNCIIELTGKLTSAL